MRPCVPITFVMLACGSPTREAVTPARDEVVHFDAVDYAHPEKYLALLPSAGDPATVKRIASEIAGATAEEKLAAIHTWMDAHIRFHEDGTSYHWRNVDAIVADGTHSGCADHALVFGSVARAIGIPTVWVKSMDADWIREFIDTHGNVSSWRGHVFLEVYLHDKWRLLDAMNGVLYDDYDPRTHLVPGNRWAYDKGGDAYALVLSSRGDVWIQQTRAAFTGFDLARLPVDGGRRLGAPPPPSSNLAIQSPVYVVSDGFHYRMLSQRLTAQGATIGTGFNADFENQLPRAVGHTLVVLLIVDQPLVLPEKYWPAETVITLDQLRTAESTSSSGIFRRKRTDGTDVYVLYGKDEAMLRARIEAFPN